MKKSTIIIFISILLVVIVYTFIPTFDDFEEEKSEEEIISDIVDYAHEEYTLYAYTMQVEYSNLYFDLGESVDKNEFQKDILSKLHAHNLAEKYTLKINQITDEERRIEQANSDFRIEIMNRLEDLGYDNQGYFDIVAMVDLDSQPIITLNITDDADVSPEELDEIMKEIIDVNIETEE